MTVFFQLEKLLFSVKAITIYGLLREDDTAYISVFSTGVNILSSNKILVRTGKASLVSKKFVF